MKKIFTLCFLMALVCVKGWGQCTTATNGLYPSATFTPTCTGSAQNITTAGFASEYSNVALTAGVTYTFRSSVTTDYITISSGTVAAVWGTTPVNFTPTTSGTYRFYTHTNSSCGASSTSRTRSVQCNGATCTPPTTQASIGSYTNNTTGNSITVNWTRGNGTGVIVVARLTATANVAPTTGTTYTANATFGSGGITGTGNYVVYTGAASSVNVTGLQGGTNYTFTVYEYNGTTCYKTPGSSSAVTTLAACTNTTRYPDYGIAAPAAGQTVLLSGAQYQIEYNYLTGATSGTSYTVTAGLANTYITIRSGTYNGPVVAAGNTPLTWTAPTTTDYYIHYNVGSSCGTASTAMVTNITNNTPAAACTTPSAPAAIALGTSTISTQPGTITPPAAIPTGYIVIASTSATLSAGPVDGTTYTTGSTIGGGLVKYVDATASFTASSLTSNTQYYYFVYSYNSGCTGAPYYSTTAATANKYTCIAAPTSLAAGSVTGNSASISWTASAGTITSYDLKYGTTSGTYTTTVPGVTSPYTLSGLAGGITYYYVIIANNTNNTNSGCGTSNQSSQASFTTLIANDLCSSATLLTLNTTVTTTDVGATYTTLANDAFSNYATAGNGDVWYKFIACNTGTATIATSSSTTQDLDLFIFNASCPTDNNTNISNAANGGNTETVNANVIAGNTYYIRVAKYNGTSGSFTITVTASVAAPSISASSLAAQTLCINTTANNLFVVADNATAYQWYSNTTASNTSGTLINGATSSSFIPPTTIAGKTYYYVVISNGCASTTSTVSGVITVNPAATATLSGAPTTCSGIATNLTVTLTGTQPWTIVYSDGTNNATISGITSSPYSLSVAPTTNTTYSLVSVTDVNNCAGSTVSGTATVSVNPATTITQQPDVNDKDICQNSNDSTLTVAATGTGTLTYQWYRNTLNNNTTGTSLGTVNGANTPTLTIPSTITGNSYYYVKITSSVCGTITSNVSGRITVATTTIGTGPLPLAQTICQNTSASAIAVSNVSGIDVELQWYSNTTSSTTGGTLIPGATSRILPSSAINTTTAVTTYYYLVVTAQCGNAVSNIASVTVNAATAITSNVSAAPQTVCQNTTATALTVTAVGTNLQYQWYSNSSRSTTGSTILNGATTSTYTPLTATPGTLYYYVVVSGDCVPTSVTSAISGAITVNPNATIALTSASGTNSQVLCSGTGAIANITYSIGGGGTNATVSGLPTGVTGSFSGGTFTISGTPTITGTFNYTVQTVGTCVQTSAVGSITVNPTPTASISPISGSNCEGGTVGITISGTPGASVTYTTNAGASPVTFTMPANGNQGIISPSDYGTYTYTITDVHTISCPGTISNATSTVTISQKPTLTLSSGAGTDQQSLCGYNYTPVTYTLGGSATTATITVTPAGRGISGSITNGVVTISGTPTQTGTYTYSIITNANGDCAGATVNGTITLAPYSWIGGQSGDDWSTAANWCGGVPAAGAPVTISGNTPMPILSQDIIVGNLTINDNTLSLNGKTLTLNGVFNGNGTLAGSASSNLVTGITTTVNFTQAGDNNVLHNLTVNGGVLTLGNTLQITAGLTPGVVTVTGTAQLASNGNLTLRSNAEGTAAIAAGAIAGNFITGDVTVERFISDAGQTGGKRAWRLLTAPLSGTSIKAAWQENQDYDGGTAPTSTGYGTIITGEAKSITADPSFDYLPGTQHHTSIRQYNAGTDAWDILSSNTVGGTNTDIRTQEAYMLFVRGDRSKVSATAKSTTTLEAKGNLFQGTHTTPLTGGNAFNIAGNPFAAPVDFAKVFANTGNANVIDNKFYVWDAHLGDFGSFVTVTGNGSTYTAIPTTLSGPTSVTQYIQSGEGFLVVPKASGSLLFTETMKKDDVSTGTGATASPFKEVPSSIKQLRVNLNLKNSDTSATLADGFMAQFDDYFADEPGNSAKPSNFNENLGLAGKTGTLMIESKPDIQKTDTLFLKMWNVTKRNYQLQMRADNFATAPGTEAWLVDNYLGSKQPISLSGNVVNFDFSVTSDSLSWNSDRFIIVFQNNAVVLPIALTNVKATPQNGGVNVSWTVTNEVNAKGYTIEKSTDGGHSFTAVGTQQPARNNAGAALTSYNGFDAQPKLGDNLYRIRIEAKDGIVTYSTVVKATISSNGSGIEITVYPNPVRDGKVNMQMTNLAAGTYLVSVYASGSGQTVYQRKITISLPNTTQSEQLILGKGIAQGSYELRISDHKGVIIKETQLVIGR